MVVGGLGAHLLVGEQETDTAIHEKAHGLGPRKRRRRADFNPLEHLRPLPPGHVEVSMDEFLDHHARLIVPKPPRRPDREIDVHAKPFRPPPRHGHQRGADHGNLGMRRPFLRHGEEIEIVG